MIVYQSDYQIFDNSWRIWNLLKRTKKQLQLNIARMQITIVNTQREQDFLIKKANHYFHILKTPEVQRQTNAPPTDNKFQHPNTPELRPQQTSSPPFTPVEEISPPIVNIPKRNVMLFHTPEPNEIRSSRPSTSSLTHQNRTTNRCRQCRSTRHQKRNCPRYQCIRCLQYRPGHFTHKCPNPDN